MNEFFENRVYKHVMFPEGSFVRILPNVLSIHPEFRWVGWVGLVVSGLISPLDRYDELYVPVFVAGYNNEDGKCPYVPLDCVERVDVPIEGYRLWQKYCQYLNNWQSKNKELMDQIQERTTQSCYWVHVASIDLCLDRLLQEIQTLDLIGL